MVQWFKCKICNVLAKDLFEFDRHMEGKRHKRNLELAADPQALRRRQEQLQANKGKGKGTGKRGAPLLGAAAQSSQGSKRQKKSLLKAEKDVASAQAAAAMLDELDRLAEAAAGGAAGGDGLVSASAPLPFEEAIVQASAEYLTGLTHVGQEMGRQRGGGEEGGEEEGRSLSVLPNRFTDVRSYLHSFLPHLLQEARAEVTRLARAAYPPTGIREGKGGALSALLLQGKQDWGPNTLLATFGTAPAPAPPAVVTAGGEGAGGRRMGGMGQGEIVLLFSPPSGSSPLSSGLPRLAVAQRLSASSVSFIMASQPPLPPLSHAGGSRWRAVPLGRLPAQRRAYEACSSAEALSSVQALCFANQLLTATPDSTLAPLQQLHACSSSSSSFSSPHTSHTSLPSLNTEQSAFVSGISGGGVGTGVHILQGPPGTGKTTTLTSLLLNLLRHRPPVSSSSSPWLPGGAAGVGTILVSASSNKAVRELAIRLVNASTRPPSPSSSSSSSSSPAAAAAASAVPGGLGNVWVAVVGTSKIIEGGAGGQGGGGSPLLDCYVRGWGTHMSQAGRSHVQRALQLLQGGGEGKACLALLQAAADRLVLMRRRCPVFFQNAFPGTVWNQAVADLSSFSSPATAPDPAATAAAGTAAAGIAMLDSLVLCQPPTAALPRPSSHHHQQHQGVGVCGYLTRAASSLDSLLAAVGAEAGRPGAAVRLERELLASAHVVLGTHVSIGAPWVRSELGGVWAAVMDEAGQATEPELLISVAAAARAARGTGGDRGVEREGLRLLVLCGDGQQLPPTVLSRAAVRCGLRRGMLRRLQRGGRLPATQLLEQHRMHPLIQAFPSARFYQGKLRPAPAVLRRAAAGAEGKSMRPLIFVDVPRGRERGGGGVGGVNSYSNEMEARLAVAAARLLVTGRGPGGGGGVGGALRGEEVVIITFYSEQAERIRELLQGEASGAGGRRGELGRVQCGTVDAFQGGEWRAVILSFVRASSGGGGGVGFLSEFRRLNVALTRAKDLLLLLGHARTLRQPPPTTYTRHFSNAAAAGNGGAAGDSVSEGGEASDDAYALFHMMKHLEDTGAVKSTEWLRGLVGI